MRELILTTKFRRDLRRAARRGKDERRLRVVLDRLVGGEPLEPRHRAHQLTGSMAPLWECHIENGWLKRQWLSQQLQRTQNRITRERTHDIN